MDSTSPDLTLDKFLEEIMESPGAFVLTMDFVKKLVQLTLISYFSIESNFGGDITASLQRMYGMDSESSPGTLEELMKRITKLSNENHLPRLKS